MFSQAFITPPFFELDRSSNTARVQQRSRATHPVAAFLRELFCDWAPWPATHPRAQKLAS